MRYLFHVAVELTRTQGKFASWEEFEDQLRALLDESNPGDVTGDHEGEYEVAEWEVTSQGKQK